MKERARSNNSHVVSDFGKRFGSVSNRKNSSGRNPMSNAENRRPRLSEGGVPENTRNKKKSDEGEERRKRPKKESESKIRLRSSNSSTKRGESLGQINNCESKERSLKEPKSNYQKASAVNEKCHKKRP
jgi:hypothetical protein